jgi:molybdate transport system ATP-binding protein
MSLHADLHTRRGAFELAAALDAASGQTVAVVGPNGAGKTTLVQALAGLLRLDAGEVVLDGQVLERPADSLRLSPQARSIGVVFQDQLLFPALSVQDNVAFGLRARGSDTADARRAAGVWLERFGLAELALRYPHQLSGGQAQRVALARALAVRPRLLILDEPLAALDVDARRDVRRLMASALADHHGVRLLITHDPLDALTLADTVVVLEGGHVAQSGSPDSIRGHPRTPYAAAFVGLNCVAGRLERGADGDIVRVGTAALRVAGGDVSDGAEVLATIHPRAILLSLTPPATSARNVLLGRITAIDHLDDRARIQLATDPPLTAEVTTQALAALGLTEGELVWALIKATEITVAPR